MKSELVNSLNVIKFMSTYRNQNEANQGLSRRGHCQRKEGKKADFNTSIVTSKCTPQNNQVMKYFNFYPLK